MLSDSRIQNAKVDDVSIPFRGFRRAELGAGVAAGVVLGFNPLPRFPTC